MITEIQQDICTIKHGIVVHGCNAKGVMGSGVAKAIRKTYPQAFTDYLALCKIHPRTQNKLLGKITTTWVSPTLCIVNGITQLNYGRDPKIRYVNYYAVIKVFIAVGALALQHNLPVYFPRIGAGLGNGKWAFIQRIIERHLPKVEKTLCLWKEGE